MELLQPYSMNICDIPIEIWSNEILPLLDYTTQLIVRHLCWTLYQLPPYILNVAIAYIDGIGGSEFPMKHIEGFFLTLRHIQPQFHYIHCLEDMHNLQSKQKQILLVVQSPYKWDSKSPQNLPKSIQILHECKKHYKNIPSVLLECQPSLHPKWKIGYEPDVDCVEHQWYLTKNGRRKLNYLFAPIKAVLPESPKNPKMVLKATKRFHHEVVFVQHVVSYNDVRNYVIYPKSKSKIVWEAAEKFLFRLNQKAKAILGFENWQFKNMIEITETSLLPKYGDRMMHSYLDPISGFKRVNLVVKSLRCFTQSLYLAIKIFYDTKQLLPIQKITWIFDLNRRVYCHPNPYKKHGNLQKSRIPLTNVNL